MARLIIAIALGLVVGVGGVFLTQNLLSHQADGTASNASIYNYGSH
jgi:hypothetical protein